jgi:asparagine synthetase B (glutamine-hydrolysing)
VYISGQGSDEILSDYGHNGIVAPGFLHSTIAGRFPSDLSSVFPWENFFGGTQEEFLTKDENVGGTYGLECRYPFLDYNVVQEFLWLHPDLKNANYKSPIFHTLQKKQYPLAPNGLYGKVGFRANSGFRAT